MKEQVKLALAVILALLLVNYANSQNITMVTNMGTDAVSSPVAGRLYLTTIPHFRNGKTLNNNTITLQNLTRNVTYMVRVTAEGDLRDGSNTFPLSQINIGVRSVRTITAIHTFRSLTSLIGNSGLGATSAIPAVDNGIELARFEPIGPSGNPTVELNFSMLCLPNSGTSNLVPGNDNAPRAYTGLSLRFSLWVFDPNVGNFVPRLVNMPTPGFSMGVQNAVEVTLGSSPQVGFRLANASMYRQNQTITRLQQATVSSNMPLNLTAFAGSAGLSTANSTIQIPTNRVSLRVTNTGIGAAATLQTLGTAASPTTIATNVPRGLDQVLNFEYRLTTGTATLVPGGTYNTNFSIRATQL